MGRGAVRTWTVERRGARFVAMAWGESPAAGPLEVVLCASVEDAKQRIETQRRVQWREPRPEERRHDVVASADVL